MSVDPIAVKVAHIVALLAEACDRTEDATRSPEDRNEAAQSIAAVRATIEATPVLLQRIDARLMRRMRLAAQTAGRHG